jgi:hypothetical protein
MKKLSQKNIFLLGIAIISSNTVAQTMEQVKNKIINANEQLTSGDTVFNLSKKMGIDPQHQVEDWMKAFDGLENYVTKTAERNKVLKNAGDLIFDTASELSQTIWNGYRNIFTFEEPARPAELAYNDLQKSITNLLEYKEQLENTVEKLELENFWYKKEQKEELRGLLLGVINILENLIVRTANDFLTESQAYEFNPEIVLNRRIVEQYPLQ